MNVKRRLAEWRRRRRERKLDLATREFEARTEPEREREAADAIKAAESGPDDLPPEADGLR